MGEECHRTLLCYGDVGKDDPFPTRTVVFSWGDFTHPADTFDNVWRQI